MIEGNGFHQNNVMLLKLTQPGKHSAEFATITGETKEEREQKALQLVLARNKQHLSATICSWLKQRQHCLETYDANRAAQAKQLLILFHYYSDFGYHKLCGLVAQHRQQLEFIAPGPKSRFFNHYINVIMPLMEECELMKSIKK